jgi:predicted O-methyltransferase YrrM
MYFNLIPAEINTYCEDHSEAEEAVLKQLQEDTKNNLRYPQMLSGHLQGLFLKQISWMIRPKKILEVGSFSGYSTLCLISGLAEGGSMISIDRNEAVKPIIESIIQKQRLSEKLRFVHADAHLWLAENPQNMLDLVFIDADKAGTIAYYEQLLPMIRPGGFMVVDNVLWNGKVVEPIKESDKESVALDAFNKVVTKDTRVENLLLPFRDGLMLLRKR